MPITTDLEQINLEWQALQNEIFVENEDNLMAELILLGFAVSAHNKRRMNTMVRATTGINWDPVETWEDPFMRLWARRNVNLIKGLTDEYIKKINDAVISGVQQGTTSQALSKQLLEINQNMSKARTNLIARDQIGKLNGQLTKRRQQDIGVSTYIWRTSRDERVRPSHDVMNGKLCRWDDPSVYSDDDGKTWKKRSSIGGVEQHPGQDYQCRCHGQANLAPVLENL